MIIPKLAIRNLLGAGLRTWLNVLVLSFAFVAIIWTQGLYQGMNEQVMRAQMDAEYGGGQYWHEAFDPYDPLSLPDAHGDPPASLRHLILNGEAAPILVSQGAIYPQGRIQSILIKGIDPRQSVISVPSRFLQSEEEGDLPALIGSRMAKSTGLTVGDRVVVRWRDAQGTFDARDVVIVQVMKTSVQSIDQGQIWIPLQSMQELMGMYDQASLVIVAKDAQEIGNVEGWEFKDLDFLMRDIKDLVQGKTAGASIMYVVLMLLAMLAIFDTQVLSIFRRRKEIGTLLSLGLTRGRIIRLFTLEGSFHAVLAALVAAAYGIPLMILSASRGIGLPGSYDDWGFAIGEKLFPRYSIGLILGTIALVFTVTSIVSYLPTRKISKMRPTDALRGNLS